MTKEVMELVQLQMRGTRCGVKVIVNKMGASQLQQISSKEKILQGTFTSTQVNPTHVTTMRWNAFNYLKNNGSACQYDVTDCD